MELCKHSTTLPLLTAKNLSCLQIKWCKLLALTFHAPQNTLIPPHPRPSRSFFASRRSSWLLLLSIMAQGLLAVIAERPAFWLTCYGGYLMYATRLNIAPPLPIHSVFCFLVVCNSRKRFVVMALGEAWPSAPHPPPLSLSLSRSAALYVVRVF